MSKMKSIRSVASRIAKMGNLSESEMETVTHMIESVVKNRDNIIKKLELNARPRKLAITLSRVTGAVQHTIDCHGDITRDFAPSAAKRIYANIQQIVKEEEKPTKNKKLTYPVILWAM